MTKEQIDSMHKQPTAVDWLFNQIPLEWTMKKAAFDAYRQAKGMEAEQHRNTWLDSRKENRDEFGYLLKEKTFEQYYNETYQP